MPSAGDGLYALAAVGLGILLNLILPQVWASAVELVNNMSSYMRGLDALVQDLIVRFNLEGDGIDQLLADYKAFVSDLTDLVIREVRRALPQLLNFGVALGSGVGYVLAVQVVLEGQRKLDSEKVPGIFRGLPVALLYIGILALAIYGFTGHTVAF